MASLSKAGDVFLLHLGDGENRFNPESVAAINRALDTVESTPEPRALVTVATGRIWSNGLDLDWLMVGDVPEAGAFLDGFQALLARMLTLSVPAVAAVQGHAFGGGAMFALAHDIRIMRGDRGYLCLPEVDLRMPFTPGMARLVQCKLPAATAHEAMTTGRRYGGVDAVGAAMVDAAVDETEVLPQAAARAQSLGGKHGATLGLIKSRLYDQVVTALRSGEHLPLATPVS